MFKGFRHRNGTPCANCECRISKTSGKQAFHTLEAMADDLTFSLPSDHKGPPKLGAMMGCVTRIVAGEGFEIKQEKTRVHRTGGRQSVTGLVVNGDGPPRTTRKLRRQLRSAIHKLKTNKPLQEGESLARLTGYAAFVHMTNAELGRKMLADLQGFEGKPEGPAV